MNDQSANHDRSNDIFAALQATTVVFRDFARTQKASLKHSAAQRHLLLTFAVELNATLLEHRDLASTLGLHVEALCHGDDSFKATESENAILIPGRCKDDGCAGCCFVNLNAKTEGISEYLQIAIYPNNTMLAQSSLDRLNQILRRARIYQMATRDGTVVSEHKVVEEHYPYDPTGDTHTASSQDFLLQFINSLRANVKKRTKQFPLKVLRKMKISDDANGDDE
jgi:hypothetical protein